MLVVIVAASPPAKVPPRGKGREFCIMLGFLWSLNVYGCIAYILQVLT
jgi:hypothetical protein